MSNSNIAVVKMVGATCSAMRMLLGDDQDINDLQIIATFGHPKEFAHPMAGAALQGRSTLVVVFTQEGRDALIDNILLAHAALNKKSTTIGCCRFVQSDDGRFALRFLERDDPLETIVSRGGRRLVSRTVKNDKNWATAELKGMKALLEKAAAVGCPPLRQAQVSDLF